jgi:hypothetical protein
MKQQTTHYARKRWLTRELEGNPARNSREKAKAKRRSRMNRAKRKLNS